MCTTAGETTQYTAPATHAAAGHFLIIMDGPRPVVCVDLTQWRKPHITFGTRADNDIRLYSPIVSGLHGVFELAEGQCFLYDANSLNGIQVNGGKMDAGPFPLLDGAAVRIDDFSNPRPEGVVMVYASCPMDGDWHKTRLTQDLLIGRDASCPIPMAHPSVSRRHAEIYQAGARWYIRDLLSTNGLIINGATVSGTRELREKDVFCIANAKFIFSQGLLIYNANISGMALAVTGLCRAVRVKGRPKILLDQVSFAVKPRELVAVIGSSGAGKTTLMNAICGLERADAGTVTINGLDLYRNFETLKTMIGYVPQQDIAHDGLTLRRMLRYTAKIRLPRDLSPAETDRLIDEVLTLTGLTGEQHSLIRKLSGGERKRASIAVELLADPGVFFLDEPTSGLDPHIVEGLMYTLRALAKDRGKTVVMITHTVQNIALCDKVAVMGTGGHLCFFGTPREAKDFFGVEQLVSVYRLAAENPLAYTPNAPASASAPVTAPAPAPPEKRRRNPFLTQYAALCARYGEVLLNDRARVPFLAALPLLIALLFKVIVTDEFLRVYETTKFILFAMSCACVFIGLFTSIQEICKERAMIRREYFAGLRLGAYVFSKISVLFFIALIQGFLFTAVCRGLIGLPDRGFHGGSAFVQVGLAAALTIFVSSVMGLLISAAAKTGTFAMLITPGVLIVQLLFSGVLFALPRRAEILSCITVNRWSAGLLGILFDLDALPSRLQLNAPAGSPRWENLPMYVASAQNLSVSAGALCVIAAVCAAASVRILRGVRRDRR